MLAGPAYTGHSGPADGTRWARSGGPGQDALVYAGDNLVNMAPLKTFQSPAFSSPEPATGPDVAINGGGSTEFVTSGLDLEGVSRLARKEIVSFAVADVVTQIDNSQTKRPA